MPLASIRIRTGYAGLDTIPAKMCPLTERRIAEVLQEQTVARVYIEDFWITSGLHNEHSWLRWEGPSKWRETTGQQIGHGFTRSICHMLPNDDASGSCSKTSTTP